MHGDFDIKFEPEYMSHIKTMSEDEYESFRDVHGTALVSWATEYGEVYISEIRTNERKIALRELTQDAREWLEEHACEDASEQRYYARAT